MNTVFVLVLLFIPPTRELEIVYDDAIFPTVVQCQKRGAERMQEANGKVLWMSTTCAEVPKNPTAGKQT